MTNVELLDQKVKASGLRTQFIADALGLSRAGLYLKLKGKSFFTTEEVKKLCDLLGIRTLREREAIFFADEVDKKST